MKNTPYIWCNYTKIGRKVWYFNGKKIKSGTIYKKETDYDFTVLDDRKNIEENIKHFNIKPFTDKGKIDLLEDVWRTELWVLKNELESLQKKVDQVKFILE